MLGCDNCGGGYQCDECVKRKVAGIRLEAEDKALDELGEAQEEVKRLRLLLVGGVVLLKLRHGRGTYSEKKESEWLASTGMITEPKKGE